MSVRKSTLKDFTDCPNCGSNAWWHKNKTAVADAVFGVFLGHRNGIQIILECAGCKRNYTTYFDLKLKRKRLRRIK